MSDENGHFDIGGELLDVSDNSPDKNRKEVIDSFGEFVSSVLQTVGLWEGFGGLDRSIDNFKNTNSPELLKPFCNVFLIESYIESLFMM